MTDPVERIKVNAEHVSLAWEYAQDVVDGYARGEFAISRKYSSRGAEKNVELWANAKIAECAFAVWADLNPLKVVKWSPGPDDGNDVQVGNLMCDVKNTGRAFLIWPANKRWLIHTKKFHALIAAKTIGPALVELHGWMGRVEFIGKCHLAPPEGFIDKWGKRLDPDTTFVEHERLHAMQTFPTA